MIRIEIDDREVRQALEDLRRRASNMKPAMHAIGQALMEGSRERILSGRDWTGQPFAPNSPVTLARKKGNKPLINEKTFVTSRLHYEMGGRALRRVNFLSRWSKRCGGARRRRYSAHAARQRAHTRGFIQAARRRVRFPPVLPAAHTWVGRSLVTARHGKGTIRSQLREGEIQAQRRGVVLAACAIRQEPSHRGDRARLACAQSLLAGRKISDQLRV